MNHFPIIRNTDHRALGRALRAERESLGVARIEVAKRLGLTDEYIGQLEGGRKWTALRRDAYVRACLEAALNLTKTETDRSATLPPVGKIGESPKGLGRDGHKPLMRNRQADARIPRLVIGGNTFTP